MRRDVLPTKHAKEPAFVRKLAPSLTTFGGTSRRGTRERGCPFSFRVIGVFRGFVCANDSLPLQSRIVPKVHQQSKFHPGRVQVVGHLRPVLAGEFRHRLDLHNDFVEAYVSRGDGNLAGRVPPNKRERNSGNQQAGTAPVLPSSSRLSSAPAARRRMANPAACATGWWTVDRCHHRGMRAGGRPAAAGRAVPRGRSGIAPGCGGLASGRAAPPVSTGRLSS